MKKCYLDANVLIHLKNKDSSEHDRALSLLITLIKEQFALYITPLIIDEFIHTMFFLKRIKKLTGTIDLRNDLQELLDLPRLSIINPPVDKSSQLLVLDFMQKYKVRPRDAYHLLTMLSNSIDIFATFDKDFNKVFAAKILKKPEVNQSDSWT